MQSEKMAEYVGEAAIEFPVCIDDGETIREYGVDSYPDYYLIDRAGNLRVADLKNGSLDKALDLLLAEPEPLPLPGAWAAENASDVSYALSTASSASLFKGELRMQNELVKERGELLLLATSTYSDSFMPSDPSGTESLTWTVHAENNATLTPRRVELRSIGEPGHSDAYEFKLEGKVLHVEQVDLDAADQIFGAHEFIDEVPAGVVLDVLVPRIVAQQLLEKDASLSFPLLRISQDGQFEVVDVTLICRGEVSSGGGEDNSTAQAAWRFDLVQDSGDEGQVVRSSYWIDEERNLLRVEEPHALFEIAITAELSGL